MEGRLESELSHLGYHFGRTDKYCSLRVNDAPEIHFPHSAGGRIAGGSSRWITAKHADGAIHEPAMVAAIVYLSRRYKNRPVVFFDIGALYGYFSLIFKALLPQAIVHAFEMNPVSFHAMNANFRANQHLGVPLPQGINVALSDRTKAQHLSKVDQFKLDEVVVDEEGIAIDLLRLDDFCERAGVKPDVIKMDVEGYQSKILPGAMQMIAARKPAILLEFDYPGTMARFAKTNAAVVQPLFDLGYRLSWCHQPRMRTSRFVRVNAADMSRQHESNSLGIFVVPQDS